MSGATKSRVLLHSHSTVSHAQCAGTVLLEGERKHAVMLTEVAAAEHPWNIVR